MNKKELIEKAVNIFSGKWPSNTCNYMYKFESNNIWKCGSSSFESLFTREEFEATAKRMGYINGYKFGIEYPTNGKKPDLPDKCQVRWFDGVETGETSAGWLNWHGVIKFEIIDQLYNPEQPEPAQQKTWFEAGEFPPVGAEFESYFSKDTDPKWNRGKVAYSSNEYTILIFDDGEENLYNTKELKRAAKFRPINPDRQQLIDIIESVGNQSNGVLADAILAAGWGWKGD